jgi:hypothetical protein
VDFWVDVKVLMLLMNMFVFRGECLVQIYAKLNLISKIWLASVFIPKIELQVVNTSLINNAKSLH